MRTTIITGALGLALAATVVTGCGSKDGGSGSAASTDYCQELRTDKAYFQSLAGTGDPDYATIQTTFRKVHTLAAAAPADISGDWKTVDHAVTTIEDVLHDSGLSAEDFAAIQKGQIPEGVDIDKLAALAPRMEALGGPAMNKAADRIAQDAKASCGIDLTES